MPSLLGRVATEDDMLPDGGGGTPRRSEQATLALVERGVAAMVIRMPQVHDRTKQGFASYLLEHARDRGVSGYVGEGSNHWPAVHRLDAARLYRSVLGAGNAGQRYHAVAEQGVPMRAIAEAIAARLGIQCVAIPVNEAADHFGWLSRVVTMDAPASSVATRTLLGWCPVEGGLLDDVANGW